jgi:N-acetylated-alpha-linked acidic dipeptidase
VAYSQNSTSILVSRLTILAFLADSSASGSRLRFSGSPLLAHSIRRVAEDLSHPTDENRTLWDATTDDGKLFGEDKLSVSSAASKMDTMEQLLADDVGVSPLGSGSDYTVFLQRIGVSCLSDPSPAGIGN